MNSLRTFFGVIVSATLCVGIAGCGTTKYYNSDGSGEEKSAEEAKPTDRTDPSNFPIEDERVEKESEFTVYIKGKVTNNSGERANYVEVNYSLYDAEGGKVGTAMDNISGLENGEHWNFEAMAYPEDFATYKLDSVTIW